MKPHIYLRTVLLALVPVCAALAFIRHNHMRPHSQTLFAGTFCVFHRSDVNLLTGKKSLRYIIAVSDIHTFIEPGLYDPDEIEAEAVATLHQAGLLPAGGPADAVFCFDSPSVFWQRPSTAAEVEAVMNNLSIAGPDTPFWNRKATTATAANPTLPPK